MNRSLWFLLPLLFCGAWQTSLSGADAFPAPRKIDKEPVYQSKTPRYGRLVFGKEGKDQVWIVHDGDLLYVDRNGNGDLTEPGERIERQKPRKGFEDSPGRLFEVGELHLGGLTHKRFGVGATPLKQLANAVMSRRPEFEEEIKKDPEAIVYNLIGEVAVPGLKGGGLDGRLSVWVRNADAQGYLIFGDGPSNAPAIRLGGPIQIDFPDYKPQLRLGYAIDMYLSMGFPGQGPGTFAAIYHEETLPAEVKPVVEIEVPSASQGVPPYREKFELPNRCCHISLYGPVRVKAKDASGKAIVTLSLPGWKEGDVQSTRHSLAIVKGMTKPPVLPVSGQLVWTIRSPDKSANIMYQKFSSDGKQMSVFCYPTGILHVWDLESRKEIRRFERRKEDLKASERPHLSSDWKTLLIVDGTHTVKQIREGDKKEAFIEYSGKVQVLDAETGEQKGLLYPDSGYGAGYSQMSPDGRKLVLIEMKSYRTSEAELTQTSLWNLKTQERRLLGDTHMVPSFSSDSKFGFFSIFDDGKKTSVIKKIDLESGKALQEFHCDEQGRHASLQGVSNDNRWLAVSLGGKLAAPPTTLFLDAVTLKEKARLVLAPDPKTYGWQAGSFSPDGKIFETSDGQGNIHLWSLEEKKVIRIIPMENNSRLRTFSPDGRFLAIAWMPKYDESLEDSRQPDPLDLPQPRISLIDLKDSTQSPILLIAPHGLCGSIVFRPDGKQIAFGSSCGVHIFDIEKLITKKEKP